MTEKHLSELFSQLSRKRYQKAQLENEIKKLGNDIVQELETYDEQTRMRYISILLAYFIDENLDL